MGGVAQQNGRAIHMKCNWGGYRQNASPEMIATVRTQRSRRFRLDLGCVGNANECEQIMENSHVGVIFRVFSTITSNTSLIVAPLSLKLSAPAMAADEYEVKAPGARALILFGENLSKVNSPKGTLILTPPSSVTL